MRKIEAKMLAAMESGTNWKGANTSVTVRTRSDGVVVTSVYLHGNLIAQNGVTGLGFCLCGWNTPTTRSRLTAIIRRQYAGCLGVSTKAGVPRLVTGLYTQSRAMIGFQCLHHRRPHHDQ